MTDKYETGYGKPPQKNKFKKGQSGNPTGRPKKSGTELNFQKSMRRVLSEEVFITEAGKRKKRPLLDAFIRKIIVDALNSGKAASVKLALDAMKDFKVLTLEAPPMSNEAYFDMRMEEIFRETPSKPLPMPVRPTEGAKNIPVKFPDTREFNSLDTATDTKAKI